MGAFPDGESALMVVAARLRHVAGTRWGTQRHLQMKRLAEVLDCLGESESICPNVNDDVRAKGSSLQQLDFTQLGNNGLLRVAANSFEDLFLPNV